MNTLTLSSEELNEIRECLELLQSVEIIELHNKNWLPLWAIKSPADLSREKLALIERIQEIIGSSGTSKHT